MAMALGERELQKIGEYVKSRLPEWLGDIQGALPCGKHELELRERMIRVEESLKNQVELTARGFDLMEKRFDQMDKRFDQVDKRFEQHERRFESIDRKFNRITVMLTSGFAVLAVLISIFQFLA